MAPFVRRILDGEADGAFSTVSDVELWQGLRPGEEARHDALLGFLERVPLDSPIARRAGELRHDDFEQLRTRMAVEFYEKN